MRRRSINVARSTSSHRRRIYPRYFVPFRTKTTEAPPTLTPRNSATALGIVSLRAAKYTPPSKTLLQTRKKVSEYDHRMGNRRARCIDVNDDAV